MKGEPTADETQTDSSKLQSLQNAYLQALADMENLRNRTKREVENAAKFSITKFATEMTGVADVLETALNTSKQESTSKEQLAKGIEMTLSELQAAFKRFGIERVESLHQKFDPAVHDAIFEVESDDHEPGTVVSVQKCGYRIRDRLLRASAVGVSKAK